MQSKLYVKKGIVMKISKNSQSWLKEIPWTSKLSLTNSHYVYGLFGSFLK